MKNKKNIQYLIEPYLKVILKNWLIFTVFYIYYYCLYRLQVKILWKYAGISFRFCQLRCFGHQGSESHPAFNLHTFRPWESCPSGLKFLIFKSGQQAQILPWWYIFSRAAGKMVHRLPQRVTRVRKIFLTVVGQEEYHLGRKRVIPPDYFCSTWESVNFTVFWILKVGNGESFRVRW